MEATPPRQPASARRGAAPARAQASGGARRRIACIFPRYAPSFGTFEHAWSLVPGVRAFMPPQGLLIAAAALPDHWDVRFIDENVAPASDAELREADAVFISGMHVQREAILDVARRAQRHDTLTVLGGPSVSAAPDAYGEIDILHVGELGDGTEALLRRLGRSVERPSRQLVYRTTERLPLEAFPVPAYHLLDLRHYLLSSVQFSSGCPFLCEFCDIPALYGRKPRLKTPDQVRAELDALLAAGARGAVYFVDDNFIANRKAARELLPHLAAWQRETGFRVRFDCEATVDIAGCPEILTGMREAGFQNIFCGIETPELEATRALRKTQNLRRPLLEAVQTINDHGLEVVSGIILGLDTDTPETPERVLEFIEASGIPMLTINLLYALPQTPLHDRLARQGRLVDDPARASNVDFRLPYEQVLAGWRRCIEEAYAPERLFARFARQAATTFARRPRPPRRVTIADGVHGLRVLRRVLWQVGVRADYRRAFWRTAAPLLRQGRIEDVIHIGIVSHHLIRFVRSCRDGQEEASFYADRGPTADTAAAGAPERAAAVVARRG